MRIVIGIALLPFVVQTLPFAVQATQHSGVMQDPSTGLVDNLVAKFFDRILMARPLQEDLDYATFGKPTHLTIPTYSRPVTSHTHSASHSRSLILSHLTSPGSLALYRPPQKGFLAQAHTMPGESGSAKTLIPYNRPHTGFLTQAKPGKSSPGSGKNASTSQRLAAVDLHIMDLGDIIRLATDEYGSHTSGFGKLRFQSHVIGVMLPKIAAPFAMGHYLRGVKDRKTGELLAFVDLSLQPDNGTTAALNNMNVYERQSQFKSLSPYMCNLLVAPKARKLGLGKWLVKECEDRALELGHNVINLHCEAREHPALKLYIKTGFCPAQFAHCSTRGRKLLFMKKMINCTALSGELRASKVLGEAGELNLLLNELAKPVPREPQESWELWKRGQLSTVAENGASTAPVAATAKME